MNLIFMVELELSINALAVNKLVSADKMDHCTYVEFVTHQKQK